MATRHLITRGYAYSASLRKWAYKASGYYKYGLMHDDLLDETEEDVQEALRRLPECHLHERTYRILRAVQASLEHDILPKDQWATFEEDVRYLSPIVEQVKQEREEREAWNATH